VRCILWFRLINRLQEHLKASVIGFAVSQVEDEDAGKKYPEIGCSTRPIPLILSKILYLFEDFPRFPTTLGRRIQISGDGGLESSVAIWRDR
jgi:hypothetical protein